MDEDQIIYGLRNDSTSTFDFLFHTYFSRLHHFASSLITDEEEAKDIVLRALRVFWDLRKNFNSSNNIRAFLYITVRNNCIDFIRSKKRLETSNEEYAAYLNSASDDKTAELKMIEAEILNTIYREIKKLPKKCRQIFELTYFEGLQAGEIARRLKISTSAVTTQRHIAIKRLRQVLNRETFFFLCLIIKESQHLFSFNS